ncbi:tetratricopeptide repeat protein [Actinoplanes sp. NPDC049681]|uniref:tetratricopeptide repeat protein n=1 Tax=Actinoplanes sp. NPDC049681 TaxID=3363905 RepID=UPI0037B2D5BE
MPSGETAPNSGRSAGPTREPDGIHTVQELAVALDALRGTRSYSELDRAAGGRTTRHVLPPSTLSDMLKGKTTPGRDTVVTFLAACEVDEGAREPWLRAWERVSTRHLQRPAGAVRVRDADPRLLGVHSSIQVGPDSGDLPVYVPRDLDLDLRASLAAAGAGRGVFLLLRGGSSVGKTRTLVEAVRASLPEWWLLHPADAQRVRATADAPPPRTVVWLDELQRYLDEPGGLAPGVVRALVTAGLVVVCTLWPDEYAGRSAPRVPGRPDPYAGDRELLGLARVVDVPDTFSAAERRRAEELAADSRIRVALDTRDAGLTQVLAAGPELIRWWEHADVTQPRQCYGKAVITAALDARRAGADACLGADFLSAAAPAYLTSAQQATAPPDWFEQALGYATTRLHGATACLVPVAAGMGRTAGYVAADYLYQHARRTRRTVAVPDAVWDVLVALHPGDSMRLAGNAARRGQRRAAEALYRRAADAGNELARIRVTKMLAEQGRVDELEGRADAGDGHASDQIAKLLAREGREEELRRRADGGDGYAAERLARMLGEQGRVDELRHRADSGDGYAADRLAKLLADEGDVDEAIALLRRHEHAADGSAVVRLAEVLTSRNRLDEAIALLRRHEDAAEGYAGVQLVELLAAQGRLDELRQRADLLDWYAAEALAKALARQGGVEELHRRAADRDVYALVELARLAEQQGRTDEAIAMLRDRPDAPAAVEVSRMLAERRSIGELRFRADAGDMYAADRLAELLAGEGEAGELRQRADAGDVFAANHLVALLAAQGRVDELRSEMVAGTPGAAERLAELPR